MKIINYQYLNYLGWFAILLPRRFFFLAVLKVSPLHSWTSVLVRVSFASPAAFFKTIVWAWKSLPLAFGRFPCLILLPVFLSAGAPLHNPIFPIVFLLAYIWINFKLNFFDAGDGIEPPTFSLWDWLATSATPRNIFLSRGQESNLQPPDYVAMIGVEPIIRSALTLRPLVCNRYIT